MSFILDALKKIEQEKRRSAGTEGTDAFEISNPSRGWKRQALSMGSIALGSAAVTAIALSTFSSSRGRDDAERGVDAAKPITLSEIVAPVESTKGDHLASLEQAPMRPRIDEEVRRDEATPAPEPTPGKQTQANNAAGASTPPPIVEESVHEGAGLEEPPIEEPLVEEPTEVEAPAATESEERTASAIRLVGRERAARGILPEERHDEPVDDPILPEDFPKLVLQGTSVIDGEPVAVISDRRVFEGDLVEGALVVRIEEREVELELGGLRFVLRL